MLFTPQHSPETQSLAVHLKIPTFHPDQLRAYRSRTRFQALRCGRRWGKTEYGITIAANDSAKGKYVGWFAPEYKFVAEAYRELEHILDPWKLSASKDGVFTTKSEGRIDFWSMENENAGRSRKYHTVILDEAAFTKPKAIESWRRSIRPTLLDFRGRAFVLSNTNGVDPDNFFWQICNQPDHGFTEYHAPTHRNPYMPRDEVEKLQRENHPLVYQQEYLAEFVDWSGKAFFGRDSLLGQDGLPLDAPARCEAVFAVIDSATKTGKDNDGTGVIYFALVKVGTVAHLRILDYDIQQIEGALLETWLPGVFNNLEAFAKKCGARLGSLGTWIEDKSSGMILIQQATRKKMKVHAIESKLTSVGKDERAISVSGYVFMGLVKICREAYDRVMVYKETSRNHLLGQVVGFRIGDKEGAKRADDLLDCFTYGIAISLGNAGGF